MISGLESALLKSSASTGAKAVGWAGSRLANRINDQRTLAALRHGSASSVRIEELSDRLDQQSAAQLSSFVTSPEFEQALLGLATEHALRACGKKSDARLEQIKSELSEHLRLALNGSASALRSELADALFDLMSDCSSVAVQTLMQGEIHPRAKARLIKCAASLASASARNSGQLRALENVTSYRDFEASLRTAVRQVHGSMRLPHAGTTRQVPYDRLFVAPTVRAITDSDSGQVQREEDDQNSLAEFLITNNRAVLLGNPGGGKSTSSLKLVHDIASGSVPSVTATTPFLVVLRDYAEQFAKSRTGVLTFLESLCAAPYSVAAPEGAIEYLLMSGRGMVVFDGLDELLDTSLRRDVVQVVEGFAHRYPLTPILVTSRLVGYDEAPLDGDLFAAVDLQDFTAEQVEAYTRKWFSLDESTPAERKQVIAESFLEDSRFVSDLRVNPLMLSLMCGIYSSENYIPRNRPDVYEKCALLLFDRWDKQRGIDAPLGFDAHVQAAMRSLALWLYPRQEAQVGLPRQELIAYMRSYLLEKRFDNEFEAEEAATQFIDFCKGRAWVLTDMGSELYGFTHRTFLEYFAASQLVRLHHEPEDLLDALWDHICAVEWTVVAQLAVQILGKTVEDGADNFLDLLVRRASELEDIDAQVNPVVFACRALEFVVPRPGVLREVVRAAVTLNSLSWAGGGPTAEAHVGRTMPIGAIANVAGENFALLTKYLRVELHNRLRVNPSDEASLAFILHPVSYASSHSLMRTHRHKGTSVMWNTWASENWSDFEEEIEHQSHLFAWVGSEQFKRKTITAHEFIRRFGPRGLYDYLTAGRAVEAPVAFLVETGWFDSSPARIPREAYEQIVDALVSSETPWVPWEYDYEPVARKGRYLSREKSDIEAAIEAAISRNGNMFPSAAVLCAAAMFEWGQGRPLPSGRKKFLREYSNRQSIKSEDVKPILDRLHLERRARSLLERWLSGSVSLVDWSGYRSQRSVDLRGRH